jgi:hypothetical protein
MSCCRHRGTTPPVSADRWRSPGTASAFRHSGPRDGNDTRADGSGQRYRAPQNPVRYRGGTRHRAHEVYLTPEVLEDACERRIAPDSDPPAGIEIRLDPLVSLLGDGFEKRPRRNRCRFGQHGIDSSSTPSTGKSGVSRRYSLIRSVTGYVYHRDGAYSSFPDNRYVVALDGEAGLTTIRARLPEDASVRVASHPSWPCWPSLSGIPVRADRGNHNVHQ